jgi:fumarylacetoacetate (FAA) hydrolase
MKLATLRTRHRDGSLIVVRRDGAVYADAAAIVPTLQAALDDWDAIAPRLHALAADVEAGRVPTSPLDPHALTAPLPRAYEWVDGSAYVNHIVLVRKARNAEPPETLYTDPLVYQGGASTLLGPRDPIALADVSWGCDLEAEVCVVLGDVPQGATATEAERYVRLVGLVNDVTLRNLIPPELAKGFGFFQSKPATAFSPFFVTPDELGDAWKGGRLALPLRSYRNGALIGDPDAGPEMHFSFHDLLAHLAKTRAYTAGTILGSGTVSNADRARGYSCIAETRALETIDGGKPVTPFLAHGETVAIEMHAPDGTSIFGRIEQRVIAGKQPAPGPQP